MKVDLYFWTLILKWGVSDTSIFWCSKGKASKKNDYLSFVCDFPRKDYFYSGNSQIVAVLQIFFTVKVGGKISLPPFLDELSQIKNINPTS